VKTTTAAKAVNVPPSTLRDAAKRGRLRPASITPGGHYLWDVEDLRRQIQALLQRPKPDTQL